jgi:hippurate hydrolase
MDSISSEVREVQPLALTWRRDLHANPEIGFEEHRTAALVTQVLERLGLEVTTGIGRTGIVGSLRRGTSRRSIGLRADMDALPVAEQGTPEWRSTRPRAFHGCGHDGHTAVLLAAATALSRRGRFDGTIHFIFQPAEEGLGGARAMLEDGLLDRFSCDALYGMHNWPGMPLGTISTRAGALMAGMAQLDIEIEGKGGHAGLPQHCVDPIHAAAQLIQALQGLVSRNADPTMPTVLSLTRLRAGDAYNVIPATAHVGGGLRYVDARDIQRIEKRLHEIAGGIGQATGARITVKLEHKFPVLVNDAECTRQALDIGAALVGEDNVRRDYGPLMGSDDFAWMLQHRPGCYLLMGSGDAAHTHMPHDPCYDFNDELLPIATSYWVSLAESVLRERPGS